jgi:hypothetical protein
MRTKKRQQKDNKRINGRQRKALLPGEKIRYPQKENKPT